MKLVIVTQVGTTQHELDLNLAGMLNRYGIIATFYASSQRPGFLFMNVSPQKNNGILPHSMTHPRLSHPLVTASRRRIVRSKGSPWVHHRQPSVAGVLLASPEQSGQGDVCAGPDREEAAFSYGIIHSR
jgi:hypothetical protein